MLIQGQNDLVSVGRSPSCMAAPSAESSGWGTGETLRVSGDLTNSGCIGYCAVLSNGGNTYDIGGTFNNTSTGGVSILAEDQIMPPL